MAHNHGVHKTRAMADLMGGREFCRLVCRIPIGGLVVWLCSERLAVGKGKVCWAVAPGCTAMWCGGGMLLLVVSLR